MRVSMRVEILLEAGNVYNPESLKIEPLFEYKSLDNTIEKFIKLIHIPGLDDVENGEGLTVNYLDFRGLSICRSTSTLNDKPFKKSFVETLYYTYKSIDRLEHRSKIKAISIFFG